MTQYNIALISTLKPIDDVRSYKKIALSLTKNPNHHLHLIGQKPLGEININTENITYHTLTRYQRLSINRLIAPFKILSKLIKLKPNAIIANTHELLIVMILYKILFGSKIIYDIQENYYYNLIYQTNYPPVFKQALGIYVRIKEISLSPFIDHFFLAEKCYQHELPFLRNRFTILENKALAFFSEQEPHLNKTHNKNIHFLFSGNLSFNSGVFTAIDFFNQIAPYVPQARLTVIGHCPSGSVLKKLQLYASPKIDINASLSPIDHHKIQSAMTIADFGIVSYTLNKSNEHRMPTKVYEYLAQGLIIICQPGTVWTTYAQQHKAALEVDFSSHTPGQTAHHLIKLHQNHKNHSLQDALWTAEEKQLLAAIEQLKK